MKTLLAAAFAVVALCACGGPLEAEEPGPAVASTSEALNTVPQARLPTDYTVGEKAGMPVTASPNSDLIDVRLYRLMSPEDRYLWDLYTGGGGGGCHR